LKGQLFVAAFLYFLRSMRLASLDLFAALNEGLRVIVPAAQLSSIAHEQFAREQLRLGRQAWERPAIDSLDAWMTSCWQEARFSVAGVPALLSTLQERELWRQMISAERPDLFDPFSMADLARRSARVLAEHQIPWDDQDWTEREDARQFQAWLRSLRIILKRNGWLTRADLWRSVPEWKTGGKVIFPAFKRIVGPAKAEAMCFDSFAEEARHAARLCRELVEAGETSIAVFTPELSRHSGLLKRTFNEVFYPSGASETSAFHIRGHALSNEPPIAGALLLLELIRPRIDHAVAGAILRSPFVKGAAEERSARALADVKLRRARELDVTLDDIERAAQGCLQFRSVLREVRIVLRRFAPRQSPSAWSRMFTELAATSLDEWKNALSELSTLALITPEMDLNTALSRLREILSRPVEVGNWSSPVQILDASSAAGAEFDHALIIGLSEEAFLRPRLLSPLVPFRLQRQYHVPEESKEDLARELFSVAKNVRATFSEELPPFVKPYIKGTAKRLPASKPAFVPASLEQIEDGMAPPLPENTVVRGGARVIKAQSNCPFKAFAEYRLNAHPPEDASFGYDALDRGLFTHKALELVWKELGSQAKLKSLGREELRGIVREAILLAVKSSEEDGPLHKLASIAEKERLETLILNWLDIERERKKPFTVEQIETQRCYQAPGLRLDLRVDRIDRLADGSLLLIDYKTGKQTKTKLEKDRPQEPQLLVYAATVKEPVDGLLFGQLTPDDVRFVGQSNGKQVEGRSVGTPKEWDDFLEKSRGNISKLAAEFVAGVAVVRPEPGACAYCTTISLCRKNEGARADEDDD
jgi:probable DNA repair protein